LQNIHKSLDKRTCGYRRRIEAMEKSTAHLESMVKRALAAGIKAKYVLMDSWFGMPATIAKLSSHLDVICMANKTPV
jgi:ribosomal protein S12 methylthiotransferase accessory factor YcaO